MRRTRFSNPELITLLTSPNWSRCEDLIKEFEEAWRQGLAPSINDYLLAEGAERRALLIELIHVELEFRLKAGESALVESYLGRFPDLLSGPRAVLNLAAAEYELRQQQGHDVDPEEYRGRFPDLADDLLHLLSLHSAGEISSISDGRPGQVGTNAWPVVPGYEILAEAGRGGMGVVYKAREPRLGRHVALKFLPAEYAHDPSRLGRFLREAQTASGLNHPHICTVHALGDHAGRPFIVMEYIEGRPLHSLIASRPKLPEITRLIGQVARALAAAHEAGVVHRDVKPENVMVRDDGYVKVLDFGLARRLPTLDQPEPGPSGETDPGTLLGTVAYMSPEQARGESADRASDVFSLGIVLYQLATGRHPFEAESAIGTLYAISTWQPVPPSRLNPEIPPALEGLIEAMLHKDPRLRPTAAEVEAALGSLPGPVPVSARAAAARPVIHRLPELAALRCALASADAGHGPMVCVAGEPGIGKTTLVEDFLAEVQMQRQDCLIGRGHCSERMAGAEAYLPVTEALGSLLRGETAGPVASLMKVMAPTWYAQAVPTAATPAADPGQWVRANSQQAMLREFCDLLRELSRRGPVVLFFDDIHWADVSTVDLISHFGRHGRGLRVLVILTYRPAELLLGPHPFHHVKLELQGKGVCTALSPGFLSREEVGHYLALAFPGHALPADFADLIHARTEGNPLFMADLVRYLGERGVIAEIGGRWALARELPDLQRELPESVRSMIQRELERLGERDRRLLSAASVQGHEFDTGVLAEVLAADPAEVEERLQVLERVHGLVRLVREYEFPNHTLTQRYAFVHVLYQQALYAGLSPSRRSSLGLAFARALEAHHREGTPAVASELACLFEVGRDFGRAARHFWLAAQNAARVFAHREAVDLARRGLRLLGHLPESRDRAVLELPLQMTLGLQLQVTEGFAAAAAKQAYSRARELCQQIAETNPSESASSPPPTLFPVLWGLWLFSKVRSELALAQELAEELRRLAQHLGDPALSLQTHQAQAVTSLCRGEPAATLRHMEQASALYDVNRHRTLSTMFGQDPGVACKAFGAVALWLLGYPDEGRRQVGEAVRLSNQLSQPSSQTLAYHFAAMVYQLCRDGARALQFAEKGGGLAAEHGFSFWLAGSSVMTGWARAACGDPAGGAARLRQGLGDWAATGSVTYKTYYLGLLAEVLVEQGECEEGSHVLAEAFDLAERTGEGLYVAELHRLQGEILARGPHNPERGKAHFERALHVARQQNARSLELRAAMSMVRLGRRLGDAKEALEQLAAVHGHFTEGFQTPDLQDARELLGNATSV